MIDLINHVNQGLLSAQHKNIQEMISVVDISFSPSTRPDLAVTTKGEQRELVINDGLLQLLNIVDFIVMSRLEGPETEYQPFCSYEASFVAALELAATYSSRDIRLTVRDIVIPETHPYSQIVGALFIAQIGFVLAHEYGHILLKHDKVRTNVLAHSKAGIAMHLEDAEDFTEQEKLADHLATEMLSRYLVRHDDYLVRDVGIAGPVLLFQWLAFCESMVGSVLFREWFPQLVSLGFKASDKAARQITRDHINVSLHGHPLGSEREAAFSSMVKWDAVSEFSQSVISGSRQLFNSFLIDAKDKKRREAILTRYKY